MTIPEPVSPEVRRSPDGRLIAYCRSARHGLWRKSDGYDCDTEDVADWTPLVPAVSPAPDTDELRPLVEAAVRQGIKDWDRDYDSRACGPITNYVLGALDYALRTREAGLRADLDQARADVGDLRHNLALRAFTAPDADDETMLASLDARIADALASGARTIPDDAAERAALRMFRVHVYGTLTSERYDASARNQWVKVLDEDDREMWRKLARELLADLGATPATGPAPAAADGTAPYRELLGAIWLYVKWHYVTKQLTTEQKELWADAVDAFGERQEGKAERWWREPAAPQAPAEPTEKPTLEQIHRFITEDTAPDLSTPAAREGAATPPLPLHEQADLLTWRVVHVPPGTTEREDTDTPITPGWWLVGHGDDPDHPDVQVHLGDRLPTSSAANPAGGSHEVEVTVQDDGWATAEFRTCTASIGESAEDTVQDWADRHRADTLRPGPLTPIQPEEA